MYTCDSCVRHDCLLESHENMPANCPMREEELMSAALAEYQREDIKGFYVNSCLVEAEGYCVWPRIREIAEFAAKNGMRRLGVAFCLGLAAEAKTACRLLRGHGFEVYSLVCKTGASPKENVGIADAQKVVPGSFEPMCNPIAQAMFLNSSKTELNIVIGLCVGHDSLFYRYSDALCTTLVTKDRALGNNPAAALYCADTYMRGRV